MFGEARRFAPAHCFKRKDVRKTVAEQENVGILVRSPHGIAKRDLPNGNFLRRINLFRRWKFQHQGNIAAVCDFLLDNERRYFPSRRRQFEKIRKFVRDILHSFGAPVCVAAEIKRFAVTGDSPFH
jgi:hypothetical protein